MMRDTDQHMMSQKPHSSRAVYSVTTTLRTIFQAREKPRLIHNSGKPRIAATKKSRPRINHGRSRRDVAESAGPALRGGSDSLAAVGVGLRRTEFNFGRATSLHMVSLPIGQN